MVSSWITTMLGIDSSKSTVNNNVTPNRKKHLRKPPAYRIILGGIRKQVIDDLIMKRIKDCIKPIVICHLAALWFVQRRKYIFIDFTEHYNYSWLESPKRLFVHSPLVFIVFLVRSFQLNIIIHKDIVQVLLVSLKGSFIEQISSNSPCCFRLEYIPDMRQGCVTALLSETENQYITLTSCCVSNHFRRFKICR